MLQEFLAKAVQDIDNRTKTIAAPVQRMRKLLEAKDKREMLLKMAGKSLHVIEEGSDCCYILHVTVLLCKGVAEQSIHMY